MGTSFHLHSLRKYFTWARGRVKQKMEKKQKKGKNIQIFGHFIPKKRRVGENRPSRF